MSRRRGLGSGLDALLPGDSGSEGVRDVPIEQVDPNPRQPRIDFGDAALDELAASIREHGIIQPLLVSEQSGGRYELIAGERRLRAARRAGLQRVPVIVRESTSQQLLELALIENVQRADLNALEEARAYQELKDEFGLSDDQIARRIGRNSREAVANTRRLLRLTTAAQEALLARRISAGHGRALLKLDSPEQQDAALAAIAAHDLNVRDAERLAELAREQGDLERALAILRPPPAAPRRRVPAERPAVPDASPGHDLAADDREVQAELQRILSTPVQLARSARELRVTIVFYDEEKLQEFFDRLNSA